MEEIVGNIQDEYDNEKDTIVQKGEESYIIDGMTRLDELSERLGIDFGETKFETVNGYLTDCLGRIPENNLNFETDVNHYHFRVLKTEKHMIRTVRVTKMKMVEEKSE
mgnify:CR=1 FL=1